MTWRGGDVWADAAEVAKNQVRQLLVADSEFVLTADGSEVHGPTGRHPAVRVGRVAPELLHARVPLGAQGGQPPRGASWEGSRRRIAPRDVLASYTDALTLRTQSHTIPGLRRPQVGAVHAVLAYLTTGRTQPCTVVMPTGTGKTETMLALLLAARPTRLLVVVPSDALRAQVATKFERLGVLHLTGVAAPTALRPAVGRMTHSLPDEAQTDAFLSMCNVVVATPAVLNACAPLVRAKLMAECTHLFVDEAHHVAARTWKEIRDAFEGRTVVQFTATPFRTDNKHVGGDIVYAFPLREAQKDGYFANINFRSVVDLVDEDTALADAAIATLRGDLDAGLDHLMMVRTSSVNRATQLLETYRVRAPDMSPVLLHSGQKPALKDAARQALESRASKIVVCVNMLGEGFDLPALKIAAIHDTQKSLGVTLQFIGRFTRVDTDALLGDATVLVARGDTARDPRLRALYAEDSDWNSVVRDLSDEAVEGQRAISEFEAGFTSLPDEVTLRNLQPKMSTVVYRTPSDEWEPQTLAEFFGEERLLTEPIGLNLVAGVAWCVVQHVRPVRWGDIRTINDTTHELFVLYFDAARRLLYINSSDNDGVFEDLAEAVAGASSQFQGPLAYRVMAHLQRLIPTNVGLLDARSAFRRFSMLVGSDVRTGFTDAEASSKTQTHIAVSGFEGGERVNISASLKGRIWSPQTAPTLKAWVDWCDGVGGKLIDSSITLESVIASFLLPTVLTGRPTGVLLAVEWCRPPRWVRTMASRSLTMAGR